MAITSSDRRNGRGSLGAQGSFSVLAAITGSISSPTPTSRSVRGMPRLRISPTSGVLSEIPLELAL